MRYRWYAVLVLLLSIFVFHSDSSSAVTVVIPEDSLNYRFLNQGVFASEVEYRESADVFGSISKIVKNNTTYLAIKKNGYIADSPTVDKRISQLGYAFQPPSIDLDTNPQNIAAEDIRSITLSDLVETPEASQVERTNFLEYPRFGIRVPIIATEPGDVYQLGADGEVDYSKPIFEDEAAYAGGNYESTPVLRKLLDGVVLMNGVPLLPEPGELGNSYIVGHGRNYANAGSPYSQIFEPLVETSAIGDELIIWDSVGRRMIFRVFANELIDYTDSEQAYGWTSGAWNSRRIVTLQTCKLEWTEKGWYPTKRWLVRAELVIE